jgi:hypothetical protein
LGKDIREIRKREEEGGRRWWERFLSRVLVTPETIGAW